MVLQREKSPFGNGYFFLAIVFGMLAVTSFGGSSSQAAAGSSDFRGLKSFNGTKYDQYNLQDSTEDEFVTTDYERVQQ